jgi:phage terminase large subunit-like protein
VVVSSYESLGERLVIMDILLPSTPEERRALSVASPVFFDTYYCGMRFAAHRQKWLTRFDQAWASAKETKEKGRLLVLAPRDHGKTEVAITYAVRAILMNRNVRILWICESSSQAEKRMRRVKALLRSEKVIADWASDPENGCTELESEDAPWTQTQLYVPRTLESVDPTVTAIGSGGAVTGAHFDLVLADDLESDTTVYTASMRDKTKRWFRATVLPMLTRGGLIITVGTRKHYGDLYGDILNDPSWSVLEDPAIKKWPESFNFVTKEVDGREVISDVEIEGECEVLWPEERPAKYLLRERRSMGSQLFAREFQNQVQDDAAAAFKYEWLETAKKRGAELSLYEIPDIKGLEIVQGWDFSLVQSVADAEKRDTDFTVGTTWARDPATGDHYLLGLYRKRGLSASQLRNAVIDEFNVFRGKVRSVAVERNAFGELHYVGLQQTTDLPLIGHVTTGKKKADPWQGVASLGVLFEREKVIIPYATSRDRQTVEPLIQELWGLGRERHDDTVMSLWIAHSVLRVERFSHRYIDSMGVEIDSNGEAHGDSSDRGLEGFWFDVLNQGESSH